jgi:ADP-ribose pyrophosphatase
VTEELLLETRRFCVKRIERSLADGSSVSREVVRHPGSVVILPLLDNDQICLIRNYRVAVGKTLIELPAGTLERGERPADCAARELIEETGFRAASIEPMTSFYAAPGILDEFMHLFVARQLTAGTAARETGEEIQNYVVGLHDALQLVQTGEICDAKTIVGLLVYQQFRVGM